MSCSLWQYFIQANLYNHHYLTIRVHCTDNQSSPNVLCVCVCVCVCHYPFTTLTSLQEAPSTSSSQESWMGLPPDTRMSVFWWPNSGQLMIVAACQLLPLGLSGPLGTSLSQCCMRDNNQHAHYTAGSGGWSLLLATPTLSLPLSTLLQEWRCNAHGNIPTDNLVLIHLHQYFAT